MGKLKKFCCERNGVEVNTLMFCFGGHRISDDDTAEDLELEEGDTIEVIEMGNMRLTFNNRPGIFVHFFCLSRSHFDITNSDINITNFDVTNPTTNDLKKEEVVAQVQGESCAGKKMVFYHHEYLCSSSSSDLHLTQLAAVSPGHETVFFPVLSSILPDILDKYKVEGDLLQALNMTREDNTFLFGSTVLVEEVPRIVCVSETVVLHKLIKYLEAVGPNIILVVELNFCAVV